MTTVLPLDDPGQLADVMLLLVLCWLRGRLWFWSVVGLEARDAPLSILIVTSELACLALSRLSPGSLPWTCLPVCLISL